MEEINKIGVVLVDFGFKKGDKLIVMVLWVFEVYVVYLVILKLGMVVILCLEMFCVKDFEYWIEYVEVKGVIVYFEFIGVFCDVSMVDKLIKLFIGENDVGWKNFLLI